MAIKAHIDIEQLDALASGSNACVARVGGRHAASWRFELRVMDVGLITRAVNGERAAYACDQHLYQAIRFLHNEIQAMGNLRRVVGLS